MKYFSEHETRRQFGEALKQFPLHERIDITIIIYTPNGGHVFEYMEVKNYMYDQGQLSINLNEDDGSCFDVWLPKALQIKDFKIETQPEGSKWSTIRWDSFETENFYIRFMFHKKRPYQHTNPPLPWQ